MKLRRENAEYKWWTEVMVPKNKNILGMLLDGLNANISYIMVHQK